MNLEAKVARLGSLSGIHRDYWDIWGRQHFLPPATERLLLEAMGFDIPDESSVDRAIEAAALAKWRNTLPPVVVLTRGGALEIPLIVPAALDIRTVQWEVVEESGTRHTGNCTPEQVAELERRDLDAATWVQYRFTLPLSLVLGYHRFSIWANEDLAGRETELIITPEQCYFPTEPPRAWGVALQLYSLRSTRNWGVGDFGDLRQAAIMLAALGADFVGVNPLHALNLEAAERASPYSPSSRSFLNPMYLDVGAMEDFSGSEAGRAMARDASVQNTLARLRAAEFVDYPTVAQLKQRGFDIAYQHFRASHVLPLTERGREFREFQTRGGGELHRFALFEALGAAGVQPPNPDSPRAEQLATDYKREVERSQFLQWQCEVQLAGVSNSAREAGMRIGLYRDLAVGCDSGGADAWSEPTLYARGVDLGAPPDELALQGQSWGLAPWVPDTLRQAAYRPFIRCLRANMRHAGALRIDHVVGLMRQFWVPSALGAEAGAYVASPFHELLGLIALESERNRCMVIGEDLGTIPEELTAALRQRKILSYCVLYFEKHWESDHSFRQPHEYPEPALATAATHDLPTIAGFCLGRDLSIRNRLDFYPSAEVAEQQLEARRQDVRRLYDALVQADLLLPNEVIAYGYAPSDAFVVAVHEFLARAPAKLMVAQIEDLTGEVEQANVPGTTTEEPNWRRKLRLPIEQWAQCARLSRAAERLRERSDDRAPS